MSLSTVRVTLLNRNMCRWRGSSTIATEELPNIEACCEWGRAFEPKLFSLTGATQLKHGSKENQRRDLDVVFFYDSDSPVAFARVVV